MNALDARVTSRVHPGLEIDLALTLGAEAGILFGPSGAGKTTILRLIAGLRTPDSGHVRIGGETLFDAARSIDLPLRRRRVGMVFQDDLLFPHLSIAGNLRFGLRGLARNEANSRVEEVAALCGLSGGLDRRPATLSGGERQRVGLARALAPRPRLLLCDEPISALDLASRNALVAALRAVQAAERLPILYVTHSPDEAVALGSRLFLVERGKLVAEGAPLDVLARAGQGATARLDGIRNVFPAVVGDSEPGATHLRLVDGPPLVVPRLDAPPGAPVAVAVLAEEILLARGPVSGLSARNVLEGEVVRILPHHSGAEVLIRTGGLTWIVSVVGPAVVALGLEPGSGVRLIIKARSCHVLPNA